MMTNNHLLLILLTACAMTPLLSLMALVVQCWGRERRLDAVLPVLSLVMMVNVLAALGAVAAHWALPSAGQASIFAGWITLSPVAAWLSLLVHLLAMVIGGFALRYLQGESVTLHHVRAFLVVIAAVQALLIADHWLILIAAWSLVGRALEPLLCFYPDRPFALLAAFKKRIADRTADVALVIAAALAWQAVGSGSLSVLLAYLESNPASIGLQISAVLLALAVLLRTASLPVHGWLIQVMEAPTPVSALLHAGVVNLGGFVLIRFAPLLEAVPAARWLLVIVGLLTAVLAGFVTLTRVSIKVRLAWSTVAQMGFMVLECGLGLYTLAVLHLMGHSLYKAHAFLAASSAVRDTRIGSMHDASPVTRWSVLVAPALTLGILFTTQSMLTSPVWPNWWLVVLALAWAPLLWLPVAHGRFSKLAIWRVLGAVAMVCLLTLLAVGFHMLPIGLADAPYSAAGIFAACGMAMFHLLLAVITVCPAWLSNARRWAYAGFYLDEHFTRWALRIGSPQWMSRSAQSSLRTDRAAGAVSASR